MLFLPFGELGIRNRAKLAAANPSQTTDSGYVPEYVFLQRIVGGKPPRAKDLEVVGDNTGYPVSGYSRY